MAGLGRVHEVGRGAGAGHGRRNLARDVAGFAHAADDQAAVGIQDQLDGAGKIAVQALLQGLDRGRFDA